MHSRLILAALLLAGASAAAALPPPVPVAPVVVAEDPATAEALSTLIADMSLQGHFDAAAAEQVPLPRSCAQIGEVMRATCYATAARMTGNPNLVFVFAEPGGASLRVDCIGPDQNRAQRADLDLAVATGTDAAAARPQRQALASCLIGALHAPSVPRPPGG